MTTNPSDPRLTAALSGWGVTIRYAILTAIRLAWLLGLYLLAGHHGWL